MVLEKAKMTGTRLSSADLDPRRRKILFRAWHRGMREMDILYGKFADAELAKLSDEELGQFETLMDAVGHQLNEKDIEIVIPVLATQLANAGMMCGVPLEQLLKYVTMTLMFQYLENTNTDKPVH